MQFALAHVWKFLLQLAFFYFERQIVQAADDAQLTFVGVLRGLRFGHVGTTELNIKPKMHHIPILYHILFTLHPQFPGLLHGKL